MEYHVVRGSPVREAEALAGAIAFQTGVVAEVAPARRLPR